MITTLGYIMKRIERTMSELRARSYPVPAKLPRRKPLLIGVLLRNEDRAWRCARLTSF